jgi:exodeoxyribonuclease VII large subunit
VILRNNSQNLATGTLNYLNTINSGIKGFESTLHHLNPENVLLRGYSITRLNGRVLKNCHSLRRDDIIDTQLHDGTFQSKVLGAEE